MKYIVVFFTLINCKDIDCPDGIPGCMVGHAICEMKAIDTVYFKSLKDCYNFQDTTKRKGWSLIDSLPQPPK